MHSAGNLRGLCAGLGVSGGRAGGLRRAGRGDGFPTRATKKHVVHGGRSVLRPARAPSSTWAIFRRCSARATWTSPRRGAGAQAQDIVISSQLTWGLGQRADARCVFIRSMVDRAGVRHGPLGAHADHRRRRRRAAICLSAPRGEATFADLASSLTVNGVAYTLVGTVRSLAGAVAANPGGDFALANSYGRRAGRRLCERARGDQFIGEFSRAWGIASRICRSR